MALVALVQFLMDTMQRCMEKMLNGFFLKTHVRVHQKGGSVHLQPHILRWMGASKHLHLLSYVQIDTTLDTSWYKPDHLGA